MNVDSEPVTSPETQSLESTSPVTVGAHSTVSSTCTARGLQPIKLITGGSGFGGACTITVTLRVAQPPSLHTCNVTVRAPAVVNSRVSVAFEPACTPLTVQS